MQRRYATPDLKLLGVAAHHLQTYLKRPGPPALPLKPLEGSHMQLARFYSRASDCWLSCLYWRLWQQPVELRGLCKPDERCIAAGELQLL